MIGQEEALKAKSIVSGWDSDTQASFKEQYSALKTDSERENVLSKVLSKYGTEAAAPEDTSKTLLEKAAPAAGNAVTKAVEAYGNQGIENVKAAASGMMKGGASMLDTAQKLADVVSVPFRDKTITIEGKNPLTQKIKTTMVPNAFQSFGNAADKARQFTNEYLQTKTLAGKIVEGALQMPAMVTEIESGRALLGIPAKAKGAISASMALLGAIKGTEEGRFGSLSAEGAAIGAATGQLYNLIGNISAAPTSSMATKILATTARVGSGVAVGSAGRGVIDAENAKMYLQDPNKFDEFIAGAFLDGFMVAVPNSKPEKLAAKLNEFNLTREKLTNGFIGEVRANLDRTNNLQFSERKGQVRPAVQEFDTIVRQAEKGKTPLRSFRDVITATEQHIQGIQNEKATAVINNPSNISSDPTLGLDALKRDVQTSPGLVNKAQLKLYDDMLAIEKAKLGKNMSVSDAWKRQDELRGSLNDAAQMRQNKKVLTSQEKLATRSLIDGYSRAIGEVVPKFQELSRREATSISVLDAIAKRSASYQSTPEPNRTELLMNLQYRSAGALPTTIGTLVSEGKQLITAGGKDKPAEKVIKQIQGLQKKIDLLSSLMADKAIADSKLNNFAKSQSDKQLQTIYNPNFTLRDVRTGQPEAPSRPDWATLQYDQPGQRQITDTRRPSIYIEGPSQQRALPPPERGFTMREPSPAVSETLKERIRTQKEAKATEGLPIIQEDALGNRIKESTKQSKSKSKPVSKKKGRR